MKCVLIKEEIPSCFGGGFILYPGCVVNLCTLSIKNKGQLEKFTYGGCKICGKEIEVKNENKKMPSMPKGVR